jgi:hypothetical protein
MRMRFRLLFRAADQERAAELDARSVDIIRLGIEEDEPRHGLASRISYAVCYRFRPGLRATYSGGDRDRVFQVLVDGERAATSCACDTTPEIVIPLGRYSVAASSRPIPSSEPGNSGL